MRIGLGFGIVFFALREEILGENNRINEKLREKWGYILFKLLLLL